MVVHHNTHFLDQTALALSQAGFEVLTSKDIGEAIAKLDKSSLIICEISPEGYSFEDLSLLRKLSPLPIIAVGNYPGREVWGRMVDAGADLYLEESISLAELKARVNAITRRRWEENLEGFKIDRQGTQHSYRRRH